MPRNVRNFWLDARIDGRSTDLSGGPVSKDGGFVLWVRQRDEGCVTLPVRIVGDALPDGTLTLTIEVEGQEDIVVTTQR